MLNTVKTSPIIVMCQRSLSWKSRGLGKNDLRRLVNEFNRTYAGRQVAGGNYIPSITLPSTFEFGDSF